MIKSILLRIRKGVTRIRLKYVYWIVEESSGSRRFSVIGNPGGMNPYRRLYLSDEQSTTFKSKFYQGGSGISVSLANAHGLAVISEMKMSPKLKAQTVRVPNFVALSLDLPATPEAYWASLGHSARDDVRRIKKKGYTWDVSADPSWAEVFCDRYHHPSISARHGNEGIRMSVSEMKMVLQTGDAGFLKVYSGDTCVAAVLYEAKNGCLDILKLGWLEGSEDLRTTGAITATYWFGIQLAYDLSCRKVNFGGTRSHLEDGVLKYKSKWGARLAMEYTKGSSCYLLLNPRHPDCYQFMAKCSFIIWSNNNTFFVISGNYPDKQILSSQLLGSVAGWFILQSESNEDLLSEGVEVLPEHLRRWYKKVPINQSKDVEQEEKYSSIVRSHTNIHALL